MTTLGPYQDVVVFEALRAIERIAQEREIPVDVLKEWIAIAASRERAA